MSLPPWDDDDTPRMPMTIGRSMALLGFMALYGAALIWIALRVGS